MSLAFLSPEWADALTDAVNANGEFAAAAGSQHARIQQVIATSDGEKPCPRISPIEASSAPEPPSCSW